MTCVFCDLISGKTGSESFICELALGYLYLNQDQTYCGRCLYIFRHHIGDLTVLDDRVFAQANQELLSIRRAPMTAFKPALLSLTPLERIIHAYRDNDDRSFERFWECVTCSLERSQWTGPRCVAGGV